MDGLLLVDKPAGPTSHDVIRLVRHATGTRRVGHAGTLDPPATGLLPVLLGVATRLTRFLPQGPKVYRGTLELGIRTTTDDTTGDVIERHDGPLPTPDDVLAAAAGLRGRILQRPPDVSAKKVEGRRLYRLARQGLAVPARPVEVEVARFEVVPCDDPAVWAYEAEVGAGTYVRALARDLGAALGCGGAVATLRRTAIGPLRVDDAIPPPADGPGAAAALVALDLIPLALPTLVLPDANAGDGFVHGVRQAAEGEGFRRIVAADGIRLLGIGEVLDGLLRPRVVLARPGGL